MKKVLVLLVCFLSTIITGWSQQGVFDVTFGTLGKVWLKVPDTTAYFIKVAVQTDGKIIAFSRNKKTIIARLNANGSKDSTFGNAGIVEVDTIAASTFFPTIVLQPDNKIVLASCSNRRLKLARFKTNGVLDSTTFGINGRTIILPPFPQSPVQAIVRKSDGKFVLVFHVSDTSKIPNWSSWMGQFKANGEADSTFGKYGFKQYLLPANEVNDFNTVLALPNGKILVSGRQYVDSGGGFIKARNLLLKVNPNGDIDSTFGVNGSRAC